MLKKLAIMLLSVAAVTTLASAPAVAATQAPPPPLTQRIDISFEGSGNYLGSCGLSGNIVRFVVPGTSCFYTSNNYQIEGSNSGGSYYYIHPQNNNNLCITASTTQYGVIKIESCVGKSNQFWWNPNNGYYYHIISVYANATLLDPTGVAGVAATLGGAEGYGNNGETMQQAA